MIDCFAATTAPAIRPGELFLRLRVFARGCYAGMATGARELIVVQTDHGQASVDALIRAADQETLFGLKPATACNKPA
jgi:hypothetical protein